MSFQHRYTIFIVSTLNYHILLLGFIGFVWSFREPDMVWNRAFDLLTAFQQENGHCRVLQNSGSKTIDLFMWAHHQRVFYKRFVKGHKHGDALITQDRIDKLNTLGFEWTSSGAAEKKRKKQK